MYVYVWVKHTTLTQRKRAQVAKKRPKVPQERLSSWDTFHSQRSLFSSRPQCQVGTDWLTDTACLLCSPCCFHSLLVLLHRIERERKQEQEGTAAQEIGALSLHYTTLYVVGEKRKKEWKKEWKWKIGQRWCWVHAQCWDGYMLRWGLNEQAQKGRYALHCYQLPFIHSYSKRERMNEQTQTDYLMNANYISHLLKIIICSQSSSRLFWSPKRDIFRVGKRPFTH